MGIERSNRYNEVNKGMGESGYDIQTMLKKKQNSGILIELSKAGKASEQKLQSLTEVAQEQIEE